MKRKMLMVACAAALWSAAAMAVPTVDDVTAADRAGDYPKAESLVREVIAAKPQSAKAHYILAEILSKEHKFADASAEAHQARDIDPTLKFAGDPQRFRAFEGELAREQARPVATPTVTPARIDAPQMAPAVPVQAAGSGIPGWVWVGGIALVLFLIFRSVSRRAVANNLAGGGGYAPQGGFGAQPGMPQPGYGPANGGNYGPGYGQAPGGGLLRTGLAAAGGVAGGMLLERMLEGNRHDENYGNNSLGSQGANYSDADQATRDLDNRPIDYGSGGNDWGGDSSGGGGDNFTPSGGGDDGGGGW